MELPYWDCEFYGFLDVSASPIRSLFYFVHSQDHLSPRQRNDYRAYAGGKHISNSAFLTATSKWMFQQILHTLSLDVCLSSKLWSYDTAVLVTNYEQHFPLIWLTSLFLTTSTETRDCVTHMPSPSPNKAAHSGFETQRTRHQKSKTGVSVAPKKDLCPPIF